MNELKTGFEWCFEENIRLLELSQWPTEWTFFEKSYFEEKISYSDFVSRISECMVKKNSMPRKTPEYLEYRMYGLVPYNLSDIQKSIQFGHGVVEYQLNTEDTEYEGIYKKWARKDKTFIILNGGTTNNNTDRLGSLQQHKDLLLINDITLATFYEPDLNDTLTAVVFLVDERTWNRELYPDFIQDFTLDLDVIGKQYQQWLERIGGPKNEFLRNFLPNFKLA